MLKQTFILNWLIKILIVLLMVSTANAQNSSLNQEQANKLKIRRSMIELARIKLNYILEGYWKSAEEKQKNGQGIDVESYNKQYLMISSWNSRSGSINKDMIKNVPFRFVYEDEFRVAAVDANRLAINTGSEILFNERKLAQLNKFDFSDAVQLLLHELNHFIKDGLVYEDIIRRKSTFYKISLAEKDRMASDIAGFVSANSHTIINSKGEQSGLIDLGKFDHIDIDMAGRTQHEIVLDKKFITWKMTQDSFFENTDLAKMIISKAEYNVFDKSVQLGHAQLNFNTNLIPDMELVSFRFNSKDEEVIEYEFRTRYHEAGGLNGTATQPFAITSGRQISAKERRFNLRKLVSDVSFSIESNTTENQFHSLKLNIDKINQLSLTADSTVVVMAKSEEGKKYSFTAIQDNRKKNIFNVKIPLNLSLIINEIIVTEFDKDGLYREQSVMPIKEQKITGSSNLKLINRQKFYKKTFDFSEVGFFGEKLIISLPSEEDISGITIESRIPVEIHELRDWHSYWTKNAAVIAEKKYFNKTELDKYKAMIDRNYFQVPIWYKKYNSTRLTDYPSILYSDTGIRGITSLWVHFTDGEVVRLSLDNEPTIKLNERVQYKPVQCKGVFDSVFSF